MLQGKSDREIAFLLTRRLAFMRPEYYLRMLLPTNTEQKVVLLSGFAVDAVAHRAGFVMCGDLEVAARAVVAEPAVVDGPTSKDKIKQLVLSRSARTTSPFAHRCNS